MAIRLIATYAKKLGLPGFSSHQFSVSVETEVHSLEDIAAENARLYATLQQSVDVEMQVTGFVPPNEYGMTGDRTPDARNGNNHNGNGRAHANGNGTSSNGNGHDNCNDHNGNGRTNVAGITDKQIDLISTIVREHNLSKPDIDDLAVQMFGGGVRTLNRLQASGLIDELFERHGRAKANGRNGATARPNGRQRTEAR